MHQIIECVPNFSDGRRHEVYTAIADAIRSARGIRVLDVSPDADHNRTVITFVGSPAGVEEAAFRGISRAKELINLDEHSGEHPRIGATDVCPFIPVKNVTSADCKALAYRLGRRIASELDICTYYYGLAAKQPSRKVLSDIRKGEYEGWKAEIGKKPSRAPDDGPAVAAPWGATVIGVRQFLIAYNVYLNTGKVEIAESIAKAIRDASGGFRYVQARGFLVDGKAQVSMNFRYFQRSPIHRVQEAIKREAVRYGVAITHSELVGMIPQQALVDAATWHLQLDVFDESQILENRLSAEPITDEGVSAFLGRLSSSAPTPGGGSVAALAGALSASLAQMVAGLTTGRKKYKAVHEEAEGVRTQAAELAAALTTAIDEDAAAYDNVMLVMRNKNLDKVEKAAAMQDAMIHAAEVPLQVARLSRDAARLAHEIARIGNPNAATDAAAGAIMAQAAVRIAALNVKVNATSVDNKALTDGWSAELNSIEGEVRSLATLASAAAARRAGF